MHSTRTFRTDIERTLMCDLVYVAKFEVSIQGCDIVTET